MGWPTIRKGSGKIEGTIEYLYIGQYKTETIVGEEDLVCDLNNKYMGHVLWAVFF
jgi:hypothetical protein